MSDLISRDALDAELVRLAESLLPGWKEQSKGVRFARGRVMDAPAIDAVPVVHARWVPAEDGSARKTCSACGRIVDTFTAYTAPYCQCGCRMDAKVGGQE